MDNQKQAPATTTSQEARDSHNDNQTTRAMALGNRALRDRSDTTVNAREHGRRELSSQEQIPIFCFGSNLVFDRFKRRCPSARAGEKAVLPEAGLVFEGGFINLVRPDQRSSSHDELEGVPAVGGVVHWIHRGDLARLDQIEGDFTRELANVWMASSKRWQRAFFYHNAKPKAEKKVTRFHLSWLWQGLLENDINPKPYLQAYKLAAEAGMMAPLNNPADRSLNPNAVGNSAGDTRDLERQDQIRMRAMGAGGDLGVGHA